MSRGHLPAGRVESDGGDPRGLFERSDHAVLDNVVNDQLVGARCQPARVAIEYPKRFNVAQFESAEQTTIGAPMLEHARLFDRPKAAVRRARERQEIAVGKPMRLAESTDLRISQGGTHGFGDTFCASRG